MEKNNENMYRTIFNIHTKSCIIKVIIDIVFKSAETTAKITIDVAFS